jgi:hypothetical protein
MGEEVPTHLRANELLARLTLANVYSFKFSAERHMAGDPDQFAIDIEPLHALSEDRVDYLFEAKCFPRTDEGEDIATIEASIVCSFDFDDPEVAESADVEVIEWIGGNVALFAAYPYIRESIQAHATRLGMPNLTMDILKRGRELPDGVRIGSDD